MSQKKEEKKRNSHKMTITYTAEVATCRGFGCFLKLLFRWVIISEIRNLIERRQIIWSVIDETIIKCLSFYAQFSKTRFYSITDLNIYLINFNNDYSRYQQRYEIPVHKKWGTRNWKRLLYFKPFNTHSALYVIRLNIALNTQPI